MVDEHDTTSMATEIKGIKNTVYLTCDLFFSGAGSSSSLREPFPLNKKTYFARLCSSCRHRSDMSQGEETHKGRERTWSFFCDTRQTHVSRLPPLTSLPDVTWSQFAMRYLALSILPTIRHRHGNILNLPPQFGGRDENQGAADDTQPSCSSPPTLEKGFMCANTPAIWTVQWLTFKVKVGSVLVSSRFNRHASLNPSENVPVLILVTHQGTDWEKDQPRTRK